MPLQKLPTVDLDNVNHRKRARETINGILDHSFDDSRAITAEEQIAGVTVVNPAYRPGDVRRYGAVMDGRDNTAAYQAAGLASLNPYSPAGDTLITSATPIRANQCWSFDGTAIEITGNTQVFTASVVNDWAILGRWAVTGDNDAAGSLAGTAAALVITDCMRFHVDAPACIGLRGANVLASPGSSTGERAEKGTVAFLQAHGCYRGFECEAGTGAEYITFIAPVVSRCNIGARVAAGNTNVIGGSISDNTTNVYLLDGANHAHGKFVGVDINHAATLLYADQVRNGHSFVGCNFYEGLIHLFESTGIIASCGEVDFSELRAEEAVGCGFVNNVMPGGYGNTITDNYNGTNSFLIWRDNIDCGAVSSTDAGRPWRGAFGNIKGVRVRNTLASSQVLSAASVNATATILLDDTANESANNLTQTAHDGYDATTGIYTCRVGGDGKVRVAAQLVITCNAADAGDFQVFMTHSALGDYYFNLVPIGPAATATSWIATLNIELPINVAETLRFRITGSGVANNVTITNSGGTKAQVEGL